MRRFWRGLKLTGLGLLGVVGLSLIWLAIANAAASSKVENKLAELRAAGQPTSLADLAREPIPSETNAAIYLARAENDVEAIRKQVLAASEAASEADRDALDKGRLTPPMRDAIQSALQAQPNAIPLLEQAADCPGYAPQRDFKTDTQSFFEAQLERLRFIRNVFRVLNYRALLSVDEGKPDKALRTCRAMWQLARHFDREPMTVSFLVSLAARSMTIRTTNLVLRSGPLSDSARDALEAELARQDLVEAFRHAIRTERAFGAQRFGEMSGNPLVGYMKLPSGKRDQADYLELMSKIIETASQPYWESPEAETEALTRRAGTLTRLLVPALQSGAEARTRIEATIRCLRILNALARRAAPDAAQLGELGLPADVLVDPYTGKPLTAKNTADGWVIYSVGNNLKDDGGQIDDDYTDAGLAPVAASGTTRFEPDNP